MHVRLGATVLDKNQVEVGKVERLVTETAVAAAIEQGHSEGTRNNCAEGD